MRVTFEWVYQIVDASGKVVDQWYSYAEAAGRAKAQGHKCRRRLVERVLPCDDRTR